MPPKPTRTMYRVSRMLRYKWFRELLVKTSGAPKGMKYSDSVPSDRADGRKALVSGTKNASLYVADLARARDFYERVVGLKHLKTGDPVPHPHKPGCKVQVCAMGFAKTPDLFLARQTDANGNLIPVADNGLHHIAFWIEDDTRIDDFARQLVRNGFELSYGPVKHYPGPGGDGGWGGNRGVYVHDPDGHFLEFSNEMDPYGTQYEMRGRKN